MIGTETEADIRHVLFSHCVIRNANKGFGINVQDGATVSDVIVGNLTIETSRRHWNWWGSAEMCKLVLKKRTPDSRLGVIRDIVVHDVVAHVRGTSTIAGHVDRPLENIRLSNVVLEMLPENAVDKRATQALQIDHVRGLRIRDLSVRWSEDTPEPRWQSALVARRVTDLEIAGFEGRQGLRGSDQPALVLDSCQRGTVQGARAADGCRSLIHVQGLETRDVTVRDSDVQPGVTAVTFDPPEVGRAVRVGS